MNNPIVVIKVGTHDYCPSCMFQALEGTLYRNSTPLTDCLLSLDQKEVLIRFEVFESYIPCDITITKNYAIITTNSNAFYALLDTSMSLN